MKLYKNNGDVIVDYEDCETIKQVVEKAIKRDVSLKNANLRDEYLEFSDMKNAILINANLNFANLRNADLQNADLSFADITKTKLSKTNLCGTILPFDKYDVPIIVDIHKKVFEACSVKETFDMDDWCKTTMCKTTKCIAGWTCTIAGKRGLALAKEIGFDAAASLIYMLSDTKLKRIPDYYASNEDTLKYLKMLANK